MRKTYPDLLIFHVPSGEHRNIATAVKLKRMGVIPGVADFLMFTPGKAIAIELKETGGVQSADQKLFESRWIGLGNVYVIAWSLDEFQRIVNNHLWPWLYNQNPSIA